MKEAGFNRFMLASKFLYKGIKAAFLIELAFCYHAYGAAVLIPAALYLGQGWMEKCATGDTGRVVE